MRAEADAAVHWHHCRQSFSYSASSSKVSHCCWKGWWQVGTFITCPVHHGQSRNMLPVAISNRCCSQQSGACTSSGIKDRQFIVSVSKLWSNSGSYNYLTGIWNESLTLLPSPKGSILLDHFSAPTFTVLLYSHLSATGSCFQWKSFKKLMYSAHYQTAGRLI